MCAEPLMHLCLQYIHHKSCFKNVKTIHFHKQLSKLTFIVFTMYFYSIYASYLLNSFYVFFPPWKAGGVKIEIMLSYFRVFPPCIVEWRFALVQHHLSHKDRDLLLTNNLHFCTALLALPTHLVNMRRMWYNTAYFHHTHTHTHILNNR